MSASLDCIFKPKSIAVVGASTEITKRGYRAVQALLEGGFPGDIYPVNPKGGELFGLPVAKSLAQIEGDLELALLCTPAPTVPAVLTECAEKGIRGAVVLALGFGESGEAGQGLENQVSEIVRRTGIRVVGPNTSGIMNLPYRLNLIGVKNIRPGRLALLVQSGNLALALMNEAMSNSAAGFSICIGVGNETDVAFHEYLAYLEQDLHTEVVLMYVEGFRNGRSFLETARRVARAKPIVFLKGGRSDAGSATAKSHTGAMAGSYATLRAALKQAGVIEVARTDELFHVGETLATQPPVRPPAGVAILSDGGGHATLGADALHENGVQLAQFSKATQDELRALLGPAARVENPVDVAGAVDANPLIFVRCLEVIMADTSVGGVLLAGLFGGYAIRFAPSLAPAEAEAAEGMARCATHAGRTLIVHSLYARAPSEPLRILMEAGIPVVEALEVACRCLAACVRRGMLLDKTASVIARPAAPAWPGFAAARRESRELLLENEARELATRYGVPLVPGVFCASEVEAVSAVADSDCFFAFKVVSSAIPHKTEAGGVILNVRGADDARAAYQQLRESAAQYAASRGFADDFRGVLVTFMLPPPLAEMIVGVKRDEQFGPALSVGFGGTAVEVWRDISLRVLPIERDEMFAMLDELKASEILRGLRGGQGIDREALAQVIEAICLCALANPDIREIELNPVFAYSDGATAVDVRVILV